MTDRWEETKMNKNYKKTIDDKDTIGYAGNEAENGYG